MKWHKSELIKLIEGQKERLIFGSIFLIALLAWHFLSGQPFEWQKIEVLEIPSWQRLLYSALVFASLGWFLYWIKFYQILHDVLVKKFGNISLYKAVKAFIWGLLLLAMYFYIVPFVINIVNQFISLIYNLVAFLLYLFPPAGLALIVYGTIIFSIKRAKKT